jgi:3-phenylpropionate/cinnamic acid dioxygenase small subunit
VTRPTVDHELSQEIAEVLVRYATSIDRKDWRRFRSCFTVDCRADYGDIGAWDGVDAITDYMTRTHPEAIRSLHRITNVEVARDSDGESVSARSYVDVLFIAAATGGGVQAAGLYDDTLVRSADGWKIARRRFTMVHRAPIERG